MRVFSGMFSHEPTAEDTIPLRRPRPLVLRRQRVLAGALLFAAGALAGATALALAQAVPRVSAKVVLDTTTDELRWARTSVRVLLDTWEPGAATGRHAHPGPAILYVLEGELEETQDGGTRTLRAGDAVWNRARLPHDVRNLGARTARAVAIHLEPDR